MAQAIKRIKKELEKINKNDDLLEEYGIDGIGPIDDSDWFSWEAGIKGPKGSPYESGTFNLNINFPRDYPFKPPKINFITKIFHVNIHSDGKICCESFHLIYDSWSPAIDILQILIEIINLLKYPNFQTCRLYGYDYELQERCYSKKDYKYYNKIANMWTVEYADGEYNDYYYNDGNITEYNNEITEIINNCENELDKIVEFYLQLVEIIEENKKIINKERIKLKELKETLNKLNNNKNFYLNKCRLYDLRNETEKKENELSELSDLYIPLPIKEKLMAITIISTDEKIHFSITCHNKDKFSKIEELLYNEHPEYKNEDNCFFLNGNKNDKNKNLKKNNIKNNDIILIQL